MLSRDPLVQSPQPLEVIEHSLDPAELTCPQCGRRRHPSDEVEELALVDLSHVLKKHVRRKYSCECGSAEVTAKGPRAISAGGRYSVDFACEVATHRYHAGTALERQARTLATQGLVVDSATLWEQLDKLARLLAPPYEALRSHVLEHDLVHVEELRWATTGKAARACWIWSIASHDAVYYQPAPVRGYAVLSEVLTGFKGTLMFDDAAVYAVAQPRLAGVTCVLSWANVRTSFAAASGEHPEAGRALALLDELFEIENDQPAWRTIADEPRRAIALDYIRDVRRERCVPVCEALLTWARETEAAIGGTPQAETSLQAVVRVLVQQWSSLTQFLSRPELPLSAAAPTQRGHQGSKSTRGSEVNALFYSLVDSAKRVGVDPGKYLCAAAEAALAQDAPLVPRQLRAARRPAASF